MASLFPLPLSSSVSVHVSSLLPAGVWPSRSPAASQLLPVLPAINPPDLPTLQQQQLLSSLLPLLTSPVVSQPRDAMGPQLGSMGLPKAGLTPWVHPTSSPGRPGQSPVLSERVQQPCDSHRAAEWLHEEQLAMAMPSQIPKHTPGTACPKSLISCCFTHVYAFSMINHLSGLLLLLHVMSLTPFFFLGSSPMSQNNVLACSLQTTPQNNLSQ